MSKRFLTQVIQENSELKGVAAGRLASGIVEAIKKEIISTGRFSLPEFGSFAVRETPKRTAMNPKTGEKVQVKAGATVKFKASPSLKEAAFKGVKKAARAKAKG
ncbi:HU family DNA-binding protein [Roseomonas sp. CCTCC AB2023176]|uniref:HU family DNA-binding protein n=1 Tax=Roseomonas sp. CCTCC AB2023176 TaxID=3342640 RepID=UPI0035DA25CE